MKVYKHPDSEELYDFDIDKIKEFPVEQVFYYYKTGDYEGHGTMILTMKDGFLVLHDMSHCSCYGPIEDLAGSISKKKYTSISKLADDQIGYRMDVDEDYYGMIRVIELFKKKNDVK